MKFVHYNGRWTVICASREDFLNIIAVYWPDTTAKDWHQVQEPNAVQI